MVSLLRSATAAEARRDNCHHRTVVSAGNRLKCEGKAYLASAASDSRERNYVHQQKNDVHHSHAALRTQARPTFLKHFHHRNISGRTSAVNSLSPTARAILARCRINDAPIPWASVFVDHGKSHFDASGSARNNVLHRRSPFPRPPLPLRLKSHG